MSQTKIRLAIGLVFMFLIAVIPTTTFVLSQNFRTNSSASGNSKSQAVKPSPKATPKAVPATSPVTDLASEAEESPTPSPTPSEPEISFGPTLGLKVLIEGRPAGKNATHAFIGLAQGEPQANPSYLLSFTVDIPDSGEYKNLSLAGLTVGNTYTAYVKGASQIATASAFLIQPANAQLNGGLPLNLITGDLNDDNKIDQADLAVIVSVYGTTPASTNWNANADFNLDGIVNTADVAIMRRHMGATGTSGSWISTPATGSASIFKNEPIGAPESNQIGGKPGYWMWVPKL